MTTWKTCPHCGGELSTVKRSTKKETGNAKSKKRLCYINAFGKPVYFDKHMTKIMDAREQGKISQGKDWFPYYIKTLPEQKALETRINAPRPIREDDLGQEKHHFDIEAWEADIENAKESKRHLMSGIFN